MDEPQTSALLGPVGLSVVAAYLLTLVGIGLWARRAQREQSLEDFYLGGRNFGVGVLFLTLFATQYSGLTVVGFAGKVYRSGFGFLAPMAFAPAIIGSYLWYAPRLQRRARARGYVTVGDYLNDRFGSRTLTTVASGAMVFALCAYILSNLKAIGYVVEASTGGAIGFAPAIVALAILMVAYENLGGMRAVAWTDVLQGVLLLAGCAGLFWATVAHYGTPADTFHTLAQTRPDMMAPPTTAAKVRWTSTLVLVAFSVSIYPHAVQRIYAARSAQTLRRSLQWMLLMPFATTLLMLYVGFVGAVQFPGLDRLQSEPVVFMTLADLVQRVPALAALVVLLLCAVVAAIMSTVDSALLSISSLLAQDFYGALHPEVSVARRTVIGKRTSWVLMAVLVYLAIVLPQTLWRITEVKLEVLVQVAPALFWGLFDDRLDARAVGTGLGFGLLITLGLFAAGVWGVLPAKPLSIHAGVWGLGANVMAAALLRRRS